MPTPRRSAPTRPGEAWPSATSRRSRRMPDTPTPRSSAARSAAASPPPSRRRPSRSARGSRPGGSATTPSTTRRRARVGRPFGLAGAGSATAGPSTRRRGAAKGVPWPPPACRRRAPPGRRRSRATIPRPTARPVGASGGATRTGACISATGGGPRGPTARPGPGTAWHGLARPGTAWHGLARLGPRGATRPRRHARPAGPGRRGQPRAARRRPRHARPGAGAPRPGGAPGPLDGARGATRQARGARGRRQPTAPGPRPGTASRNRPTRHR